MVTLTPRNPYSLKTDLLVLFVCGKKSVYVDSNLDEIIERAHGFNEFSGNAGQEIFLSGLKNSGAKRILVKGLGPVAKVDTSMLRNAAGSAVKKAVEWNLSDMVLAVPDNDYLKMGVERCVEALGEGCALANYVFDPYLSEKKKKTVKKVRLAVSKKEAPCLMSIVDGINTVCTACRRARDWVSMPSNKKTPEIFAELLKETFEDTDVSMTLYHESELEDMNFGAMLAVSRGSLNRPVLAVMDYSPNHSGKTVVLVGKGVTFDSGGLDLKTAEGMLTMKMDMAGAAAVAATVYALSELQADIRVIGITPLVENMPSGDALRPGDIISGQSGKTIEIGNTDAEGRLILSDALSWAAEIYKPHMMIDLATLTGACMIALGDKIAGLFSTDPSLTRALKAAGERCGEICWPMPMPEDYKELLKSDFADIGNLASSKYGGAITAALFLSEFTGKTHWAHLDIAGPAYAGKATDLCPPGGTGFGVRLLCELLSNHKS